MAVCEFCHATVVKDADSVKDLGKMSAVLEDYSRIQVGTDGTLAGRHFSVVGRIQLRYSAGMWNEWYLLFDDGSTGWLGDSSGMYVLTTERELGEHFPSFDEIRPGQPYEFGIGPCTAAEQRVAQCIGGQGELPFRVGVGWQARVADFRSGTSFATLDYSDGDKPVLYAGSAVTLEQMQCQLLREDDRIKETAGKFRGRVASLLCPSCGAAIAYLPGLTANLVCQGCHTQLDAATPQVQVLAKGEQLARVSFTIPLGAQTKIGGQDYQVIGAMVRADDEGAKWTEYLLYGTRAGFSWLVETDEGWSRATVMPEWPAPAGPDASRVKADGVGYGRLYSYPARVEYAAGAFNWRVAAGDVVQVAEFESGKTRLAAEWTREELTWSRSTPVAFDQVAAWFGMNASTAGARAKGPAPQSTATLAKKFMWWIFGLNLIPLLLNFGGSIGWVMVAMAAIFLPSIFLDTGGKDKA
jgi:hypothetical protein